MLKSTFGGIKISAIATAVPANNVTAEDMYEKFGKEIVDRTIKMIGVRSSHQSIKKQISSDLGYVAAAKILSEKNIDVSDIGLLIYVTQTPDYRVPASALVLHKRLGLSEDCAAFDINLGCSGFVYGMHTACSMLKSLSCKMAMCIVGDTSSKLGSPENRASSLLFGDGTSAILLEKDETAGDISFALKSDGNRYQTIIVPFGEFRSKTYEAEQKLVNRSSAYPLMNGTDVFTFSIKDVVHLINDFLSDEGRSVNDYDCVVLHQANLYMMKQVAKKIKASESQLLVSIDRFGNTSGASVPLTLVDHYGETGSGVIHALMSGFGVGLSWGVMSADIMAGNILPMIFSDDHYSDDIIEDQKYN